MSLTLEEAKKLQDGERVSIDGMEDHDYVVTQVVSDGDKIKVDLVRDDGAEGMATFFTESHLSFITLAGKGSPVSKSKGKGKKNDVPEGEANPGDAPVQSPGEDQQPEG